MLKCEDCVYCDKTNKKCHPQSSDCKIEYDLTDDDIYKLSNDRCDFYKPKLIKGGHQNVTG